LVCDFWRQQAQAKYQEELLEAPKDEMARRRRGKWRSEGGEDVDDALYQDAIRVVCDAGRLPLPRCSGGCASLWRAARLID